MPRFPAASGTTESLSAAVYSRLASKVRERVGVVHPLHVGDTYREPPPMARAEAQLTSEVPRLHNYSPVQGEPALLEAIARRLAGRGGRTPSADCIQVMAGATAGISCVANVLLDRGDEVLLPSPYWPLVRGIFAGRGAVPIEIPLYHERLDAESVERALSDAITERTVAIYLNSPNNPSGRVLPPEVVDAIARLVKAHDLWVIADEAYEELWFTEVRPAPLWSHPELAPRTVATHTLSKSYGLAGARIGFTHGPSDVMRAVRAVQTFTTYCASRPMQLGAARALDEGDGWLAEARAEYRDAAHRAASVLGVDPPEGGTFLFFDASRYLREGEDLLGFLERCLDAGVLLTPGSASGRHFERWARLCFTSVAPSALDDALDRLVPVLRS
jgi:N-succinyldiaminopimelate aminotransferase